MNYVEVGSNSGSEPSSDIDDALSIEPESTSDTNNNRKWLLQGLSNLSRKRHSFEELRDDISSYEYGFEVPGSVITKLNSDASENKNKKQGKTKKGEKSSTTTTTTTTMPGRTALQKALKSKCYRCKSIIGLVY